MSTSTLAGNISPIAEPPAPNTALAVAEAAAAAASDAQDAADAAQADADAALAASKIVRFPVTITGISMSDSNNYVVVPAPGAGTLVSFDIAVYPQIETGDLTIYASQFGFPYAPGATLTPADPPGQTASAAPVGASYAAGAGIEFEIATANTAPGVCVVMVTYDLD